MSDAAIKPHHRREISLVLMFTSVALAAWGCNRLPSRGATSPPESGASTNANPVVEVTTTRVRRGAIAPRVSAAGSLVAKRESHIGTEVVGRIQHVFVSEGNRVEAGAPLFQIDPTSYEMARRSAESGLVVAEAERRQLETDLARARTLGRQKVVAQQDLDRLATQLEVALARERQAQESVALARHNVERTTVRAPYGGSVTQRLADEGTTALVQPQTIVIVLQETGELEAHAAIPESQLAAVQVGDTVTLRVEGLPETIETVVSSVNDSIDPATRTYLVKMPVPNPAQRLKAGVFAHVEIAPRGKVGVLLVPSGAVRTEEGRMRVLAVRDRTVVALPIEVGLTAGESTEVTQGLQEGDEIIVGDAARTIAPGMQVHSVPASEDAAG